MGPGQSFRSLVFLSLFLSWTILSCKINTPDKETTGVKPEKSAIEKYAEASSNISANKDFYKAIWSKEFVDKLGDLPKSGTVPSDKVPYSGNWYPEAYGGTARKWDQYTPSALEKYDMAFNGGELKAKNWELQNHAQAAVGWAGHCNGWSAAAQRHKEPAKAVPIGNVTFEPRDVKALLAEIHMSAKSAFLGGKRCESSSVPTPMDRPDPTVMDICEDVNPGVLHLVVTNWIGIAKHAIIFDYNASNEVWNYPIYGFSIDEQQNIDKNEALSQITGSSGTNYRFNPNAQSFVYIKMTLNYANALDVDQESNTPPTLTPASTSLRYILEIDADGNIIGGEWTQRSQQKHPDFLWVALEPTVGNGTKYYGDPYLDVDQVIKIWAQSVSEDPANPPLDILEPAWMRGWGKFKDFEVALDGGDEGAVFLGKKTKIVVKRKENLYGNDVSLDISYNGNSLGTFKGDGSEDLTTDFDSGPGMNLLNFTWKKGDNLVANEDLRFYSIP